MGNLLFYVTPLTVGLVLVALLVGAFCLARSELRSSTGLPRGLLAACTLVFFLFIAAPLGEWDQMGSHTRDLDWDPVGDISEAFADTGANGDFSTETTDGRLDQHTPETSSADGRAEFPGPHGTAFFLHGDTGNIEVVGPERDKAPEHLLGLLLFVPVGILAFHSFTRCWARLSFGPALSVGVESVQWAMAAGSTADTAHVMLNTAGSVAGTVIAVVCLRAARRVHTGGPDRSPSPMHPVAD
ncbi:VanZ family protein [Nocardiopsis kunsanensis]|uniref:VanZ family protein n=1 Tax=Nocardiopsis kunsanensis TaxID=141693 RepID=UPI0003494914|nr:VanZ family protein [Nocardiopsis kunsanensis]